MGEARSAGERRMGRGGSLGLTKGGYDVAAAGEDAPGADILHRRCVLESGHQETCSSGNGHPRQAGLDGILGMIALIVAVRRHLGWLLGRRARRKGTGELGEGALKDEIGRWS